MFVLYFETGVLLLLYIPTDRHWHVYRLSLKEGNILYSLKSLSAFFFFFCKFCSQSVRWC